jgi:hypothetical protein
VILAALVLGFGATALQARRDVTPGFDHAKFGALLATAVANGRVDYARFKNNADFTAYLASLENAQIAAMPANDQLAFWINAYNACVIKNVLDNPGMRKPVDVKGFFDARKFKVAGKQLTLNDIENNMVRAKFKEPLIHFGLVCAALNCPPLLAKVYTGKDVRAQLARNATAYLASRYNRYDSRTGTIMLSKIFDWYKADFGGDSGLKEFLKKYGTAEMKTALAGNVKIGYLEYDWTLNSK